jgi:bifunctional N-acetylglucosamine-1-phosphate-uridyltransferase/glucosamine-1-phosphate-acetyltransferase GlmU-like protein
MVDTIYIIAAGNGSRLGSKIPKALYPIAGEPNIQRTIRLVKQAIVNTDNPAEIVIVCSKQRQADFEALNSDVAILPISSGLGDGHAVMTALAEQLYDGTGYYKQESQSLIIWGDAVLESSGIIEEAITIELGLTPMMLPVVMEKDPYVSILLDNNSGDCISADFSKMGEHHPSGFHDQCIFKIKTWIIFARLEQMHAAYWKNGRYTTETKELTFLYLIHYLYNIAQAAKAYTSEFTVHSFNTVEEAARIEAILLKDPLDQG